jgi:LmbE family N-acetylglucosaminyl deacetylase
VKGDLPGAPWYPRKVLHYFSTHLRPRFSPTFVFDISDHLDKKMASIRAYESQFLVHAANSARLDAIRNEALFWGDHVGTKAGEPFVCRESIRIADASALFSV